MKKDQTLQSILKEVEEPRVEVFLDEKLRKFLKQYAGSRQAYNEALFNKREQKVIMDLLDQLFASLILRHEHAETKLSLYSKRILEEKDKMTDKRKDLQALGGNIFDARRTKKQTD